MSKKKPNGYWTEDKIIEIASKYESISDFRKDYGGAYAKALGMGILNNLFPLDKRKIKPHNYWTRDKVFEESKKYKSRAEFSDNSYQAYSISNINGWLNEMDWLIPFSKPKGYWSENPIRIEEESKKYKSRSEFSKGNPSAYNAAIKLKLLDKFTWLKDCKNIDGDKVDCVYVYKFESSKTIYVGRSIDPKRRDIEHKSTERDTVRKFVKSNNLDWPEMEIIEDNLIIRQGMIREGYWTEYYREAGWTVLNKMKTGGIGTIASGKWDYNSCKEEASKYNSRFEFSKNCSGAYNKSKNEGWLKEFFPVVLRENKRKEVDQLDLDGNYIKTFPSILQASISINVSRDMIKDVCFEKRDTAGGYKWRFHESGDTTNLTSEKDNNNKPEI